MRVPPTPLHLLVAGILAAGPFIAIARQLGAADWVSVSIHFRLGGGTAAVRSRRLALAVAAGLCVAACDALEETAAFDDRVVHGGDATTGRAILASGAHGCGACHAIPGIRAARGVVGPPLDGFARRGFIAGQLPNRPAVLIAFLENAPALVPRTGMPNVGLSAEEARHVAAYLYSLEPPDAR